MQFEQYAVQTSKRECILSVADCNTQEKIAARETQNLGENGASPDYTENGISRGEYGQCAFNLPECE
jgi:hypothetical protein